MSVRFVVTLSRVGAVPNIAFIGSMCAYKVPPSENKVSVAVRRFVLCFLLLSPSLCAVAFKMQYQLAHQAILVN